MTKQTTHTPGPWGRNIPPVSHYPTIYGGPKGAHLHVAHVLSGGGKCVEECEANARLIAAAPELLAALQEVKEWIRRDEEALEFGQVSMTPEMLNERFLNVREAIAKATW